MEASPLLPATMLCGFLGAGKTSLLNHVLNNREGKRVAALVNDMSEVNIDADLIRDGGASLSHTSERLVELKNGCICCTLRSDLHRQIARLAGERPFDYLLIEATGFAEPLPIAAAFSLRDESGHSVPKVARLDTVVTVVDAHSLTKEFNPHELLRDHGQAAIENDRRTLGELLVDQIEFADLIVVNKASSVNGDELARVRSTVKALNTDAVVLETDHGKIPVDRILNTNLFREEKVVSHPLWFKELYGPGDHLPETDTYGMSSFVFRARRPFHPHKLRAFLQRSWSGLLRAKGYLWLATQPDHVVQLSIAGSQVRLDFRGLWWCAVPQANWPNHLPFRQFLRKPWDRFWGDRRQELVFMGTALDERAIRAALEECLVGSDTCFDDDAYRELKKQIGHSDIDPDRAPAFLRIDHDHP